MNLNIDTTRRTLVVSPTNVLEALPPDVTIGDVIPVLLAFLERNPQPLNTGYPVFNYLDLSASGIILSVGSPIAQPTSGGFDLTFSAVTASAIPFDVSAYALEATLNLLSSVVSAGGLTVKGNVGGPFVVTFNENGTQSDFTSAANSLFPLSNVIFRTLRSGDSNSPKIFSITLSWLPIIAISDWTPQPSAVITVEQISGNVIQRVSIPQGTYGGMFTLTYNGFTTSPIPYAAQLNIVENAINSLSGIMGATVWPGQNYWDIYIPGGSHTLTGDATGLQIPLFLMGTMDLSVPLLAQWIGFEDSIEVPFYIQSTSDGVQTLYSNTLRLLQP